MPVSYIDIPTGVSHSAKEKMSREVFDAIHQAWPIPDTRILIREWPAESVSQDGRIETALTGRERPHVQEPEPDEILGRRVDRAGPDGVGFVVRKGRSVERIANRRLVRQRGRNRDGASRHPERLEDVALQVGLERVARHARDRVPEQRVAQVRIGEPGARPMLLGAEESGELLAGAGGDAGVSVGDRLERQRFEGAQRGAISAGVLREQRRSDGDAALLPHERIAGEQHVPVEVHHAPGRVSRRGDDGEGGAVELQQLAAANRPAHPRRRSFSSRGGPQRSPARGRRAVRA